MIASPRCSTCGTELAPVALACPACGSLVHGEELRSLAKTAETLTGDGELAQARATWDRALSLVPSASEQHQQIRARMTALAAQINAEPVRSESVDDESGRSWWKGGLAGGLSVVAVLLGKLKFLGLGLLKMQTLFSMLAFVGVYWTTYGWPLACGVVASIYIHEMGHVSELRRLGIAAGAPLFVPGVGAFVLLKERIEDPVVDARIGLAGPLWGLGAGATALAVFILTGNATWGAIAELTGFINLFNLIPVWQLDGSRGFHALSNAQRLIVVAAAAAAFAATGQKLLILIGAVAAFRAFQSTTSSSDNRTLATFVVLIVALSWLARSVG
jgi:Zn-dependent protease